MKYVSLAVGAVGLLVGGIAIGLYINERSSRPTAASIPTPQATVFIETTLTASPAVDPELQAAKPTCRAIDGNYRADLNELQRMIQADVISGDDALNRLKEIKQARRDAKFQYECYALDI